jgi:hypothetical protein
MAFVGYRGEIEFAAAANTSNAGPNHDRRSHEVTAVFGCRRQRFNYVVTEFESGSRFAPRGEGEKALSDDAP